VKSEAVIEKWRALHWAKRCTERSRSVEMSKCRSAEVSKCRNGLRQSEGNWKQQATSFGNIFVHL